ncbi:hypothetical protein [Chromobacterium subtsugae]|nr:hypothetical protein [Chromobacterium subtsugae]
MSPLLQTINRIERRRAVVAAAKSIAVCVGIVVLLAAVNLIGS